MLSVLYCILNAYNVILDFHSVPKSNLILSALRIARLNHTFVVTLPRAQTGSPLLNGDAHSHGSAKRKLAEDKGYIFDKRLRYNVRQSETNYRFRDIIVRKEEGFTHVLLSSQTSDNNALTPEVSCTDTSDRSYWIQSLITLHITWTLKKNNTYTPFLFKSHDTLNFKLTRD